MIKKIGKGLYRLRLPLILLIATPIMAAGGEGHHGVDWVKFTAKCVNVAIFFGGLFYFIKDPIRDFFASRGKEIRDSLALAEKSREEAKQRLDEIQQKMSNMDQEIQDIEARAKEEAELERKRIVARAQEEAERIVDMAKTDIENRHRQARQELRQYITDLALDEAEAMIRESVTSQDRENLFARFTTGLGAKS